MIPPQMQGVSIPTEILRNSPNGMDPGLWSPTAWGRQIELEASEANKQVITVNDKALYRRWHLNLRAERVSQRAPIVPRSFPLVWTITVSTESGIIVREITTLDGTAQGCYATGRSLTISVTNLGVERMYGFFALDEGDTSSGVTDWPTGELLNDISATPTQLAIPPFAHTCTIQTDGASAIIVTGVNPSGVTVYQEQFGANSASFRINPLLTYFVASPGPNWFGAALYDCRG